MPTYVSANLLASYLAVAARQTLEGSELSERSRWAIAHARRQLQSEHDVLIGAKPVTERSVGAALRTSPAANGPSLAAVLLRSAPESAHQAVAHQSEREQRAAEYLSHVLDDLAAISDSADSESARRLAGAFAAPDRLAA